jgi:hypothetical protein
MTLPCWPDGENRRHDNFTVLYLASKYRRKITTVNHGALPEHSMTENGRRSRRVCISIVVLQYHSVRKCEVSSPKST